MNQPIAAINAEKLLIGSILHNESLLFEAQSSLVPADFFDGQMRRLFVLMGEMAEEGRQIETYNLVQYASERRKEGESLVAQILECADMAIRRESVAEYVKEISDKAKLRGLVRLSHDLGEQAYESADPQELIGQTERELFRISANGPWKEVSIEQLTYDTLAKVDSSRRGESVTTLRTGLSMLDVLSGGLGIGELTIMAGRPSMGKSCMLAQAVIANCLADNFCHVISIEMTAGELLTRIWAALSGVSFGKITNPQFMSDEEMNRVRSTAMKVSSWPLLIDDSASVTPDYVMANAKLVKRKRQTKLLCVDYLQRMNFPGAKKDLFAEVGDATRRFAELAKSEDMAVMLLSSLTEKSGSGANTAPSLTDLRNSGDIQYHAHKAYLIHRERDEGSISPNAIFIVAKNRHGRTGAIDAVFNSNTLLFEDRDGQASHVM